MMLLLRSDELLYNNWVLVTYIPAPVSTKFITPQSKPTLQRYRNDKHTKLCKPDVLNSCLHTDHPSPTENSLQN